jgi:hydroxymethylpyrimidine kinase/phosphomethylpyrimidine kinase/thiamine-phosphate diphosphorylase
MNYILFLSTKKGYIASLIANCKYVFIKTTYSIEGSSNELRVSKAFTRNLIWIMPTEATMKLTRSQLAVYVITPPTYPTGQELADQVEQSLKGGATIIQLRRKGSIIDPKDSTKTITITPELMREEALLIQALCKQYNVPFLIDDNVQLAADIKADGVHIGQDDMPIAEARKILGDDVIIGLTANKLDDAIRAYEEGADYVGSGAVFATGTKNDATPLSHKAFETICRSIPIPVVAIGGITESNMDQLDTTGLAGFAIISDIFNDADIETKTSRIAQKANRMVLPHTALTIAGSDSSGGAGIQADLKTMMAHHVYGMSAITALTAQNTTGVTSIFNTTPQFLGEQLDAVFTDIRPDAVKIGMLSTKELIQVVAEKLRQYDAKPVVLDPVMVATSGARLIDENALDALVNDLLPLATVITPNIPEAEILSRESIKTAADMEHAAKTIFDTYGCTILLKGGHTINDANDLVYDANGIHWITGQRIQNPNTHGTGCTLSSAIASNLAKGYPLLESIERAKRYISLTLSAMLDLGQGSGPLEHGVKIKNEL